MEGYSPFSCRTCELGNTKSGELIKGFALIQNTDSPDKDFRKIVGSVVIAVICNGIMG